MPEFGHAYEIWDVFTDTPLQGNQLAVFIEGEEVPSRLMQAAARELNFSETVFLLPGDESCDAQVRIFTPAEELPFAGHPVLGAAFVVAERDDLHAVRLQTGAGIVPVRLRHAPDQDPDGSYEHGDFSYAEMQQPIPEIRAFPYPEAVLQALGIERAGVPVELYVNGPEHLMVGIESLEQLTALKPDMAALALAHSGGICVFTVPAPGEIRARVFCPGLGVSEDPATGSAAGPMVLHLLRHGLHQWGEPVTVTQGVEIGRPSKLHVRVDGTGAAATDDVQIEKIAVGGSAVQVAEGHFRLQ